VRLFAKFFLCATCVISVALLLSGYLLITFSYESAINREIERAINQFQYDKFTIQAGLLSYVDSLEEEISPKLLKRLSSEVSGLTAFFAEDKTLIYSDLPVQAGFSLPAEIPDGYYVMQMQTVDDDNYITVNGRLNQSGVTMYLLIATDISGIIAQKEQMMQRFVQIYFTTLLFSMVLILILSLFITKPIKRMNKAASEIARGRYNERLSVSSGDEIGELSGSFNLMADAVESKICELVENARQKEDFAANFAHELKTPLTSVIGYADMLYQKILPPDQVKDAALYILNEGLRLEALSLKLMDLFIMNRQDFILEEIRSDELIKNIAGGLKPVLDEKRVTLQLNIQSAFILVEQDLCKTLLLNLIDNAIKAGCDKIEMTGRQNNNIFIISITDNGRGIPASELARITEAFYTVDKSRSRKQHGAGLGLALAERIAEVHGCSLAFDSVEGVGTTVKIAFIHERSADDA